MKKILHILPLLLLTPVLLTPFIYSSQLYNGVISAKQFWFYGAMALLMAGTGLQMLFSRKPFTISLNKIDIALLAFYAYYLIRAATTPYMPLLENTRFLNWTLCVVLYYIIKRTSNGIKNEQLIMNNEGKTIENASSPIFNSSFFIINFLILTGLAQAIWGLLQLYGFLPSFNSNFKITGTFFNPAPYALYLAVIFPLAFGTYLQLIGDNNEDNRKGHEGTQREERKDFSLRSLRLLFAPSAVKQITKYLSLTTTVAILLVLPATMIRAAWLGALAGSLVVLQYKYHYIQRIKLFLNTSFRRITALAVTLILIASLGTGIYFVKKDSANGKLFIWEVTLGKIAQNPLFGYGVGRFEAEYNNWQSEYFQKHPKEMDGSKGWVAGNTKYAFNEFLELSSETGIIGLLLFIGIGFVVIRSQSMSLKRSFDSHSLSNDARQITINDPMTKNDAQQMTCNDGLRPNDRTLMTWSLFPSFITIIVIAVLSFPFYNIPLLLMFFVALGLVSANIPIIAMPKTISVITIYPVAAMLFIIPFWLGTTLQQTYVAYKIWQQANLFYSMTVYEASTKEFEKAMTVLQNKGEYLQMYGKSLQIVGENKKSINILEKSKVLTTDHVLFTTLGDVYKSKGLYNKAEDSYLHAYYMIPHKIYPLYLLAKLNNGHGNKEKAVQYAKKILGMKAKAETEAVREIKEEMGRILRNERVKNNKELL